MAGGSPTRRTTRGNITFTCGLAGRVERLLAGVNGRRYATLWAPNSRELFYLSATGVLMRIGVVHGSTWAATAPTKLFEGRYGGRTQNAEC